MIVIADGADEALLKIVQTLARLSEPARARTLKGLVEFYGLHDQSAEERRRKDRERKAALRGKSADASADTSSESPQSFRGTSADTEPIPQNVCGTSADAASLSLSQDLPSGSPSSKPDLNVSVTDAGDDADEPYAMPEDCALGDEARAIAAECGVRDVGAAWAKFVPHYVAKAEMYTARQWIAKWRVWCVRERNYESSSRRGPARTAVQPIAPERRWKPTGTP